MSPWLKAGLVAVAGYVATLLGTGLAGLAVMIALNPGNCAGVGKAMMVLWGLMAADTLLATALVGLLVWRLELATFARLGITAAFLAALLVTFVPAAFVLMVVFNC